jgi:hypothetical protein
MNALEKNHKTLQLLIKGLSNEEISSVKKYLNCFDDVFGNTITKTANLFDLLISEENYSLEEIIKEIYPYSPNVEAFDKLSKRLMEKIHECLLLDINIDRKDAYPDYVKAIINVRKKIMQSEILLGRGLTNDIDSLYDKIILKAQKFELYSELVEVLYLKQHYVGIRNGKDEYNKISDAIQLAEKCRNGVYRACSLYYDQLITSDFSASNQSDIEQLQESINDLKNLYSQTKSATIGYYYFLMEFELLKSKGQYMEAKAACLNLVDLIQDNPAIYQKRRLGSAFVRLSTNELYTYDFKDSALHARIAQDYFNKNTINYGIAKETEFYSHFYQGDLEKAHSLINALLKDTGSDSEFLFSKRSFLAANVSFLMKDKKSTNQFLMDTKEINKDKEGWNIGIRILSIISQIEAGVNDPAEAQVESMRKHIERTMKQKEVRGRDIIILRILNELVNQSFDFKAVWKSRKHLFDQLASQEANHKWQIKGHELIVFHEWFKAKVNNTEYSAKIQDPAKVVAAVEKSIDLSKAVNH